jgi:thioredoxin 1
MKKLFLILAILSLSAVNACNLNNAGNPNATVSVYKEGVVNQMNEAIFKKMIWDFSKNPNQWNFTGDLPCIIDFYADWCRPCRLVAPIMDELAKEYQGKVRIFRVNTDEEKELASLFRINSIPAVMLIPKNGQPQMAVGSQPKDAYLKAITEVLMVK